MTANFLKKKSLESRYGRTIARQQTSKEDELETGRMTNILKQMTSPRNFAAPTEFKLTRS